MCLVCSFFTAYISFGQFNAPMSHLSHKLPWHLLVDACTPYKDPGISLPVGICDRIHVTSKKVELQVKNRKYIKEDDICTDPTCITRPETKLFRKNNKRTKIFAGKEGYDEEKCMKFFSYFEQTVLEFARTELNTPVKDLEYEVEDPDQHFCQRCNKFITLLEFGDKKDLFKYSNEEIEEAFSCQHGGQAVGRNLPFLLDQVLRFYLTMNVILHAGLEKEDWPRSMKPGSVFRTELLHPHDGQTFLPHCRKYLSEAMIDLEKTKILNKNLFKFIYFYVMMKMKVDKNYSLKEDVQLSPWFILSHGWDFSWDDPNNPNHFQST